MKNSTVICAIALFLAVHQSALAYGDKAFEATAFSVEPSYPLTRDDNDLEQLSDGVLNPFPIWTHRASVGWQKVLHVVIAGRLRADSDSAGQLRFRVARRTEAGVEPPARIDAYCDLGDSVVRHAGSYQGSPGGLEDARLHDIAIPLNVICEQIQLVLHSRGTNIFLDEIGYEKTAGQLPGGVPETSLLATDMVADSKARLRKEYLRRNDEMLSKIASFRSGHPALELKPCAPWAGEPIRSGAPAHTGPIQVIGVRGEHEPFCVGLLTEPPEALVSVDVSGDSNRAVKLFEVDEVVAADGRVVRDPLLALEGAPLEIQTRRGVAYLWADVDLAHFPPGTSKLQLDFALDGYEIKRSIDVHVSISGAAITLPEVDATVWAYSDSMPVWRTRRAAVQDLHEHGVRVAVIPPHRIPQPSTTNSWDVGAAVKLTEDLKLLKDGSSLILLALGWSPGIKPTWLPPTHEDWTVGHRQALRLWYSRLQLLMSGAGLEPADWALYPVDEPHGKKGDFLASVVSGFESLGLRPKWYANPSDARRGSMSTEALVELAPFISYWQPMLTFAEGSGRSFFSSLDKEWWVYHVPPYPAKSASPLEHYLLPAWRAFVLGARGTGVWSYSDTQSSSAWDDFDGTRADWAMVYEGENSPIASRRWEAFKNGLEDLALLAYLRDSPCSGPDFEESIERDLGEQLRSNAQRNDVRARLLRAPCLSVHGP